MNPTSFKAVNFTSNGWKKWIIHASLLKKIVNVNVALGQCLELDSNYESTVCCTLDILVSKKFHTLVYRMSMY